MISREQSYQMIKAAKEMSVKYQIEHIENILKNMEKAIDHFAIRVLYVGSFSAGKSAMINALLGKGEYLVENQAPETAIATELYYAKEEKVLAKTNDGKVEKIEKDATIDIEKYTCVMHHIDSELLRELTDYVIVDTPGFDSGIEKHNKALLQYIGQGTAYIVVIDCEKGTIPESSLNFINEIMNYSEDIGVLLNKCDKKSKAEVQEVKENIEQILSFRCGKDINVVTCSKYDPDIVQKITELMRSFRPQELFEKNITTEILGVIQQLIEALKLMQKKASLDLSLFDEEIANRQKAKEKIIEQIRRERKKLNHQLHGNVKEKILNNVKMTLLQNSSLLADAYKSSAELFKARIAEMIRPILITSLDQYTADSYSQFIENLDFGSLCTENNVEEIGAIIETVAYKIQNLTAQKDFDMAVSTNGSNLKNMGNNLNGSYKLVATTLAITTSVVAPWIEIIIVFLPEILKLFGFIAEQSQDKELKDAIENKVIPQIVSKMTEEMDRSLQEVEEMMMHHLESSVNEILEIENQALEEIKTKKEQKELDFEAYQNEITKDINRLLALA